MKTPRIEEMVGKLKRKHPCIVTDKMAIGNQSNLYIDLFSDVENALTEAHQAGIDEAVGIVEGIRNDEDVRAHQSNDSVKHYAVGVLDRVKEALQDNK